MARKVFFSFHYELDNWRVQKIKNMGVVEGQPLLTANEWEDVADKGDAAIKRWIDAQMIGKSCNIVLIGSRTAGRKWVEYEFRSAWDAGKGVLGIHIHNLTDVNNKTSSKGANPFRGFTINGGKTPFETVVPVYDPSGVDSAAVYKTISNNIEDWVENAIAVRQKW